MVKRKGLTSTAWILIVAVALVGGGVVSGNIDFSALGDEEMAPDDDDAVASMSFKVKDALADDLTYTAADYYVYDSDGLQVASGETSTSDFTTVADLDENSDYTVRVVDDDGTDSDEMYHAVKEVSTGESVSRFVVEADRQGTLSTSVIEDSGAQDDDSTLSISQGQTETFTLEMEENTADAAYNNPAVFVKTNDTAAISNVEVSGASSVDVPDRISSYSDGYDTGITQLADFESGTVDVQVTRDDSNTDPATVTLLVADGDEYQTGQDTWEFGFEDDSDSDIRATDYTEVVDVVS